MRPDAHVTIEVIGQLIGMDEAAELSRCLGGRRIYVPRTVGPTHPLAACIGIEAAQRLADEYAGAHLELPLTLGKRRQIVALAEQGLGPTKIREKVGCSRRLVFKVLAEERRGGKAGPSDQLRLL
jgi:hypothetical protein